MKSNPTAVSTNPRPNSLTSNPMSQTELAKIANLRTAMLLCVIPWLGCGFGFAPTQLVFILDIGLFVFHFALMAQCYEQAKALRKNAVLFILLALIPLINLMVVARLVVSASRVLKANKYSGGWQL